MREGGYILIHRKIRKWEWYSDGNTTRVFLELLLTANYKDSRFRGYEILRGQAVFGIHKMATTLGITVQSVRTALNKLKSTNEITITATNKFSIATLVNYELYQIEVDESTSESTSSLTNEQQTNNKRTTTSNKERIKKEGNKEYIWQTIFSEVVEGNKDKPLIKNYTQMYEFIQNKKADHLMALEEFVMSYDEFEKLVIKSKEKQVPVNTIIQAMVNSPGHFPTKGKSKKKSLYLTASSWIDNEYNRQNHKG